MRNFLHFNFNTVRGTELVTGKYKNGSTTLTPLKGEAGFFISCIIL